MQSPPSQIKKVAVRAGAGAGKTTNLTHEVLTFAQNFFHVHQRWPRIVVTTFTRKATQELRERLFLLAVKEFPELVEFVQSPKSLLISTLHGVMDLFLRHASESTGHSPHYDLKMRNELGGLERSVLRDLLFQRKFGPALLEHFELEALVSLLARLSEGQTIVPGAKGIDQAFVENFIRQQKKIMVRFLRESLQQYEALTVPARWEDFGENLRAVIALSQKTEDFDPLFIEAITQFPIPTRVGKLDEVAKEWMGDFGDELKEWKELCEGSLQMEFLQKSLELHQEFEFLAHEFQKELRERKRAKGILAVSDLESETFATLLKSPAVAKDFSSQWDYWLIDEFQDTSPIQVQILKQLIGEKSFYFVGDPQQSIYLFRGARSQVFSQAEAEIKSTQGDFHLLDKNYRSRPALMNYINSVVARMGPAFQPMQLRDADEKKDALSPLLSDVVILKTIEPEDEERGLLQYIQRLLEAGVKLDEIGLLARKKSTLQKYGELFKTAKIPYFIHTNQQLGKRREIQDLMAFLKFLILPDDNRNLLALLRSPWLKIEDKLLAQTLSAQGKSPHWEKLRRLNHPVIEKLNFYLQAAKESGLYGALYSFLLTEGLLDASYDLDSSGRIEANIWKVMQDFKEQVKQPDFQILKWIAQISTDSEDEGESESQGAREAERINLMTIHASKGLQFDHVLLPDLNSSDNRNSTPNFLMDEDHERWAFSIPYGEDEARVHLPFKNEVMKHKNSAEEQESWRVLYVALTRAAKTLYLSWSGKKPSTWVTLLEQDLVNGAQKSNLFKMEIVPDVPEQTPEFHFPRFETAIIPSLSLAQKTQSQGASLAVTQALKNHGAKEATKLSSASQDLSLSLGRMTEGTKAHFLFQLLKYPSKFNIPELVDRWFHDKEQDIVAAIEFVKVCKKPPLLKIIQHGEAEWSFIVRLEGRVLEGQIDLWGVLEDGSIWIVDYKTGSPQGKEKAFEQLNFYAHALRLVYPEFQQRLIQLAVVYPLKKLSYTQSSWTFEEGGERLKTYLFSSEVLSVE